VLPAVGTEVEADNWVLVEVAVDTLVLVAVDTDVAVVDLMIVTVETKTCV